MQRVSEELDHLPSRKGMHSTLAASEVGCNLPTQPCLTHRRDTCFRRLQKLLQRPLTPWPGRIVLWPSLPYEAPPSYSRLGRDISFMNCRTRLVQRRMFPHLCKYSFSFASLSCYFFVPISRFSHMLVVQRIFDPGSHRR